MQKNRVGDLKYCWRTLPKVSRSFGLCISMLPKPTKDAVMISYLLCRVADTIEDSRLSDEEKAKHLEYFKLVLQTEEINRQKLARFGRLVADKTPSLDEQRLIKNTHRVLNCFSALPTKVRASITRWVTEMAEGMKHYGSPNIKTFSEQNIYCYYVAVTVGNLLTELFYHYNHLDTKTYRKIKKLASDFGLGLQKVNIIRDLMADLDENRKYWPEELLKKRKITYANLKEPEFRKKAMDIARELIIDAKNYLNKALEYILMLPRKEIGIRVFCAIPLFMAVASLEVCLDNVSLFVKERKVKISRERVSLIVKKALACASSNAKLRKWYSELSIPVVKKAGVSG